MDRSHRRNRTASYFGYKNHIGVDRPKGKKKGSRKLIARGNIADALQRHGQRRIKSLRFDRAGKTREAIAKEVGISLVSVYRILRTRKDAEKAPRRD